MQGEYCTSLGVFDPLFSGAGRLPRLVFWAGYRDATCDS
jgi:hypothetical protein